MFRMLRKTFIFLATSLLMEVHGQIITTITGLPVGTGTISIQATNPGGTPSPTPVSPTTELDPNESITFTITTTIPSLTDPITETITIRARPGERLDIVTARLAGSGPSLTATPIDATSAIPVASGETIRITITTMTIPAQTTNTATTTEAPATQGTSMSTVVTTGSIFGLNNTLPILAGAAFLGLGALAFLGGLALGAAADGGFSASAKRDEGNDKQYYQKYESPASSYLSYAKRSMEAFSPVLEMLRKAYGKYS